MAHSTVTPSARKIVRIRARPGLAEVARNALLDLERDTRAEAGCRSFTFFQALAEPDAFLLVEEFADEQALAIHMDLPHTRAFFSRDLVAEIAPFEQGWMS
ncbi:putative quinol monooxygenase [Microvirga puerhi]|uniref:Antibiotic biosynthesis monooxygenase n=1 Tax=Microvirga puerhi TaxID=2876078 RepID=A0ABS7VUH8_9HYPH|nr:putative quinol monooxygenase [Microvirga puerhi]MBZ6078775.1 antibiotic biosynthesis monooxygenase [Microvirga puerhi]